MGQNFIAAAGQHPEPDQPFAPPRSMPAIFAAPPAGWRASCLDEVGKIPAGYTYLAQLLGHDTGSSIRPDDIPYVQKQDAGQNAPAPARYNLIENPLTLETIYGAGPRMVTHLYDPATWLFRIKPAARLAAVQQVGQNRSSLGQGYMVRFLYDERNRDTLMLHEITVAFMQFHNMTARQFLKDGASVERAYIAARMHCVQVWHGIIRNDLLPQFVRPDVMAKPLGGFAADFALDEVTLLHGVFRAFHALPLSSYDLNRASPQNLGDLLKQGVAPSEAEIAQWKISWARFLDRRHAGPRTGLSTSIAPELIIAHRPVAQLDLQTAQDTDPRRLGSPMMRALTKKLPVKSWRNIATPKALADTFAAKYPSLRDMLSAKDLETCQLSQALLVEAQLHGHDGGFGPLGSAVLRCAIEARIARVKISPTTTAFTKHADHTPSTLLDLFTIIRR